MKTLVFSLLALAPVLAMLAYLHYGPKVGVLHRVAYEVWGVIGARIFNMQVRSGAVLCVNQMQVYQTLAREAAAIFEENAPFCSGINRAREQDFERTYDKYKPGSTVNITIPPTARVYKGATFAEGGSAEDTQERVVPVTFADATDRFHTTLAFSTFEKVFNNPDAKADYMERILKPKMASLASAVEAEMIKRAVQATANHVGTPGTPVTAMLTIAQARAKLSRGLTPLTQRSALITDGTNVGLVDANKGIFNPSAEISKEFTEGYIGYGQGAKFYECVNMPAIGPGNDVTGLVVSGASQTGSNLVIGGVANGSTFLKGQVFTIAGVFAVHPLTGVAYGSATGDLQQFVVTADTTATTTTVTLPIYPAITPAMPNRTVSASPADTAVITPVGAASTTYKQNLMYNKDAYTVAMMPLPIIASCIGYTYSAKGFSMRVMTFGDGKADIESTRIDILATLAAPRAEWGVRVTE